MYNTIHYLTLFRCFFFFFFFYLSFLRLSTAHMKENSALTDISKATFWKTFLKITFLVISQKPLGISYFSGQKRDRGGILLQKNMYRMSISLIFDISKISYMLFNIDVFNSRWWWGGLQSSSWWITDMERLEAAHADYR